LQGISRKRLVLFLWEEGGFLYPVSDAFLQAVQGNTRRQSWSGRITTAGGVRYEFSDKDIVKEMWMMILSIRSSLFCIRWTMTQKILQMG
jgi:hypothetical protein